MRKNALIICCFVCAFGAFGAFSRWLQNQLAFDTVTGVLKPSMWNVVIPVILIGIAIFFIFLIRKVLSGLTAPTEMYDVFRGTTVFHSIAAWIIGGLSAVGGIAAIFGTSLDPQHGAMVYIGLLMILTGLSFPSICTAAKRRLAPAIVSVFSAIPIVVFTIWLIACYMRNASVPNVWRYGIEIITVSAIIIAFYYNAGFAFGKPRTKAALYSSMLAAFLALVSLSDSRAFGLQLILCSTAAMLLMYCWMIVSNMREPDKNAAAEEIVPEEAVEEPETEEISEEETVIPAGKSVDAFEPTLQAPSRRKGDDVDAIINEIKNE